MPAQVIVLAGPSGAGKSRLAQRLAEANGWPILRLDDFYREADEPGLPRLGSGANKGLVDWDDPQSWDADAAVTALLELCRTGSTEVPDYSISESRRTGTHRVGLAGATRFCAEGIFAAEVVEQCREARVLVAAYCITQHPLVTFWRRLTRDLREHRKPPLVLIWRGITLARDQRAVVRRAVAVGCRVATGPEAFDRIQDGARALAD